ncbi:MAG: FtsQ-type POTRA domain-containing protein [Oscillospiraceae bacterium]|nr:FtsQ-type POTRA domain-containing protein [Oscillospiraceae bacterium]
MQENAKRRNPQQVRRRRKSNMSLYYGTILFIAAVIFAILSVTVFFNIETVAVKGSSQYTVEEIIAASGINGGDNMIRKNMGKAEEKITSELIYIETAEIKRKLPSTVEISVTPCTETACMQKDGGFFVVSGMGKILKLSEDVQEGLLIFYGANPAEDMDLGMTFASEDENKTEVIYDLLSRRDSGFVSKITSFDVTDRLNISCVYDDRINIELGVISEIDYKFRLAEEIITTKISSDARGQLRMLENGGQFLSEADIEQIEELHKKQRENAERREREEAEQSEATETSVTGTESESVSETVTKLNFE